MLSQSQVREMGGPSTSSEQNAEEDNLSLDESLERNRLLSLGISSFSGDFTTEELKAMVQEQLRQSKSSRRNRFIAVFLTYGSVLFETFASHSLYFTLIPYLVQDPVKSDSFFRLMYLISYAVAFLSGFFTDKKVSRYWTLVFGFVLFLAGYIMLFVITDEKHNGLCHHGDIEANSECFCGLLSTGYGLPDEGCPCFLVTAMVIVSIGIGLVWGNNAIYGADQIDSSSQKFIPVYFHLYYFFIQVGIGMACFVVFDETTKNSTLLAAGGLTGCCVSFFLFLAGSWIYQKEHTAQLEDPFKKVVETVSMSLKTRQTGINQRNTTSGSGSSIEYSHLEWLIEEGHLDRRYVDGVRRYFRLMLVFFSLVFFETVLPQQDYLLNLQGHSMKLPGWELPDKETNTMKYPMTWFTSGFNLMVIVILIPMILFLWFYSSRRQMTKFSLSLETVQDRLMSGLLCSAMSFVVGGLVTSISVHSSQSCSGDNASCSAELYRSGEHVYEGSGIYIKWETFQGIFSALSEILVRITAYQLSYLEAPNTEHYRMQGMFVCLLYLSGDIGVGLAWASISLGEKFFCDDIVAGTCQVNVPNLIWYYYIIAVFQMIGFLLTLVTLLDYLHWRKIGSGFWKNYLNKIWKRLLENLHVPLLCNQQIFSEADA